MLDLTVPVQKGKTQLTSGEVAVIYRDKWQQVHLRAIQSAYGRAPYFEHYFPQIEQIIKTEHKTIFDLGTFELQLFHKTFFQAGYFLGFAN